MIVSEEEYLKVVDSVAKYIQQQAMKHNFKFRDEFIQIAHINIHKAILKCKRKEDLTRYAMIAVKFTHGHISRLYSDSTVSIEEEADRLGYLATNTKQEEVNEIDNIIDNNTTIDILRKICNKQENKVIELLLKGNTRKETSDALSVSKQSISLNLKNVKRKYFKYKQLKGE